MQKFQIKDRDGNIIDKDLSYEKALLYIDNSIGKWYTMEIMKEEKDERSKKCLCPNYYNGVDSPKITNGNNSLLKLGCILETLNNRIGC